MPYTPIWIDERPQILAIASRIKEQYPEAWNELKVPHQKSRTFINRVSMALIAAGIPGGVNLKRGGPEESIDALAFPNATGVKDSTGTYPAIEIIDIVGGAEGPNPSITWGDQTQVTMDHGVIGGWKAGSLAAPKPAPSLALSKEETHALLNALNAFYAAPEGLQRPGGLVRYDAEGRTVADTEAMAQWFYQLVVERKSLDDVKAQIKQSHEWQEKHR